jgi:hypothetical protein
VESISDGESGGGDVLRRDLEHALRERLAVGCVVPTGSVPRTKPGKAKRLAGGPRASRCWRE